VFFEIGPIDPVKLGLVASINRPGGNVTGVGFRAPDVAAKRLELLSQLVPDATTFAYLNGGPGFLAFREESEALVQAAASVGRQLVFVECRNPLRELDACFASLAQRKAGGVVVSSIPPFGASMDKIIALAAEHRMPAIYPFRPFVVRGGLASYEASFDDSLYLAAGLVGRILNGTPPADLPVRETTKFEFTLNLKTAKELGLTVPSHLLVFASEVIE
jgi:putative ABC transport system substrate-binding protein